MNQRNNKKNVRKMREDNSKLSNTQLFNRKMDKKLSNMLTLVNKLGPIISIVHEIEELHEATKKLEQDCGRERRVEVLTDSFLSDLKTLKGMPEHLKKIKHLEGRNKMGEVNLVIKSIDYPPSGLCAICYNNDLCLLTEALIPYAVFIENTKLMVCYDCTREYNLVLYNLLMKYKGYEISEPIHWLKHKADSSHQDNLQMLL